MRAFYPVDFRDPRACAEAALGRDYPAARRSAMAALLRRQAERWGFDAISRDAIARFENPRTVAVVAGQQPGLFGGPLYTLYKALTAIVFARELTQATATPAVPIFWVASDDHDFDEVRRVVVGDGSPEQRELLYPAEAAPAGVSVSRISLGPSVRDLLEEAGKLLPPAPHREEILATLRAAYAEGNGWSDAFARMAGGWVAPLGALVFDPSDPEAKRLALPIFEREIELGGRSADAARRTGEALVGDGYHAQIVRTGQELNLFWHGERREALRLSGNGTFHLAESGRDIEAKALRAMAREHPEDVSPGVLLRPLVQDYLFPTAGYVGGPSEVAYWAQVNALYPLFDMKPPAVVPRSGATLLEPKVARVLSRFGIEWGALAGDVETVIGETLKRSLPVDFPALFERERSGWVESMKRIEDAVTSFDPSLRAAAETATGKVIHDSQILEKKLMQSWKRRHEETVHKIRRAGLSLFPGGGLQERTLSVLAYAARYGPGLIRELESKLTKPGTHVLVSLEG